jgi:glucose/arabinose dehydrogenase
MQMQNSMLIAAAGIALAACSGGGDAPAPAATPDAASSTRAAAQPLMPYEDTAIELPDGFHATIFADNLERPRHIAVRDNGDVYVTLRSGQGQVTPSDSPGGLVALRDEDGDGHADRIEHFGRQDADTGLAIHDGALYYSSTTAVYAIPLEPDALVPGGDSEVVVDGIPMSGGGHASKPITFDDNGHMYVHVGVPSNSCQTQRGAPGSAGQEPCPFLDEYGGIFRYDAGARNQHHDEDATRFTTGSRNVVALQWNPVVDHLYMVMHGRDQLDQLWPDAFTTEQRVQLPAEEFHRVDQGDNYGWPYTYYDQIRGQRMIAPEYGGDGETPAEPGKYKEPLIGFPGHWAPDDLIFYTSEAFPARYRGGALIAFHGSWNRQPDVQAGYAVVFVPMGSDGLPSGDWEVFADDFEGPSAIHSPAEAAHRPTGLAQGPDGALYVTDDTGGRVWRITYTGG